MLAAGCATTPQRPVDLVISDVHVVDVKSGTTVRDRAILIDDGRIVGVVASDERHRGARSELPGGGAYVIPGLWDMHAHVRGNGLPAWITTDWMMPLLVANGVTGVRDMNSDCENAKQGPVCLPQLRQWQREIEAGTRLGPHLLALSSWPINPPWDYAVTETQARALVQKLAADSVDNIKIYYRLSPQAFGWILAETKRAGLTASGHVPLRVPVSAASEAGLRSIEHARDFLFDCFPGAAAFRASTRSQDPPLETMRAMVQQHDPALCREIFATLVRNDTWYVPTHVTRRMEAWAHDSTFLNDPRNRYLPAAVLQSWRADAARVVARDPSPAGRRAYLDFYRKGLEITGAAHDAGVRVLVGTDAGDSFVYPGFAVHDELAELVSAGFSPAEALRSATLDAAEFLGLTSDYGAIEPTKYADLVLLRDNPLADIAYTRQIVAVVLGGTVLQRARLDALLDEAETAARQPLN